MLFESFRGRFISLIVLLFLCSTEVIAQISDDADVNITVALELSEFGHIRFDVIAPACNSSSILLYIGIGLDCFVNVTWQAGQEEDSLSIRFSSKENLTDEITQLGCRPGAPISFDVSSTYVTVANQRLMNVCEVTGEVLTIVGNSSCGATFKYHGLLSSSGSDKMSLFGLVIDWTSVLWWATVFIVFILFYILIFTLIYGIMRYNMEPITVRTLDGVAPLTDVLVSNEKSSESLK